MSEHSHQQPVIEITPHDEGEIEAEPPRDIEYTVRCRGADKLKAAVFQVSADSPPQWTSRTGFTELSFAGTDTVTFKGRLTGDRDRLVAKTLDEKHEDVTTGVRFKRPAPPPGGGALERARKVIAPLRFGLNVERGEVLWSGWLTDDVLRHYRDAGVTHLRFFPPSGGKFPLMDPNDLGLWIDACRRTIAQGMAAHLDFLDVMGIEHMSDAVLDYVRACARKCAEADLDPNRFMAGAVNEYAGGSSKACAECNTTYNGWRQRLDDAIHEALPNHVVVTNGGWWGDPEALMAGGFAPRPDRPQLIQWHRYEWDAGNPGNQEWWQGRLDEWARNNGGVVTYCGEWGIGPPDNSNGAATKYTDFPKHIFNAASGMGQQRPTQWCITKGDWWRLNESGSARLRPEVEAAVRQASDAIAAQQWWKGANR